MLYILSSSKVSFKRLKNKSLLNNVKRIYFLIGNNHLEMFYKMRFLKNLAKLLEKIMWSSFHFFMKILELQLTKKWNLLSVFFKHFAEIANSEAPYKLSVIIGNIKNSFLAEHVLMNACGMYLHNFISCW